MTTTKSKLIEAEKIARALFHEVVAGQLILPGKTEKELNEDIFVLAETVWHKKILAQKNCTQRG